MAWHGNGACSHLQSLCNLHLPTLLGRHNTPSPISDLAPGAPNQTTKSHLVYSRRVKKKKKNARTKKVQNARIQKMQRFQMMSTESQRKTMAGLLRNPRNPMGWWTHPHLAFPYPPTVTRSVSYVKFGRNGRSSTRKLSCRAFLALVADHAACSEGAGPNEGAPPGGGPCVCSGQSGRQLRPALPGGCHLVWPGPNADSECRVGV